MVEKYIRYENVDNLIIVIEEVKLLKEKLNQYYLFLSLSFFIFFYTMVKVFQGSQYIQILFKFGQHFKLTQKILSEDLYIETLATVLKTYDIKPIKAHLLKYQMIRKANTNEMNITAVLFLEVQSEPTLKDIPWTTDPSVLNSLAKMITPNLPGLQIFAEEGSEVQLIK